MAITLLNRVQANSCSSDGSVIVGVYFDGTNRHAAWWDKASGTPTALADPSGTNADTPRALNCSSDGSIIVGTADLTSGAAHAYYWDKGTSLATSLPITTGGSLGGIAMACSGDGSIIVGRDLHAGAADNAVWWDKTTTTLTNLANPNGSADALGISSDGTTIVGTATDGSLNVQPVWWNKSTGAITFMSLPAGCTTSANNPMDSSSDGSFFAGTVQDGSFNDVPTWWDKATGTPHTLNLLFGTGARAFAISDDGSTIIGWAFDAAFNPVAVFWDRASGAVTALPRSGSSDGFDTEAFGISADGTVAVGYDETSPSFFDVAAWWDFGAPPPGTPVALPPTIITMGSQLSMGFALLTIMRARITMGTSVKPGLSIAPFTLPLSATVMMAENIKPTLVQGLSLMKARISLGMMGRSTLSNNTPLPVFPNVPQGFPLTVKSMMANVEGGIPSGRDLRAWQQKFPIWEFDLDFPVLRDQTQNQVAYQFLVPFQDFTRLVQLFLASIGQYGQFLFDAPWDDSRLDQVIGTGDDATTDFVMVRTWGEGNLQMTEPVGAVNVVTNVKVANVLKSTPTDYVIRGRNTLHFNVPPTTGAVITSTFSYYYLCQFAEDQHDYVEFFKNWWSTKIKIRSVFSPDPLTTLLLEAGFGPRPSPVFIFPDSASILGLNSDGSVLGGIGGQPWNDADLGSYWRLPEDALSSPGLLKDRVDVVNPTSPVNDSYAVTAVPRRNSNRLFGWSNSGLAVGYWDIDTDTHHYLTSTGGDPYIAYSSADGSLAVGFRTLAGASLPYIWDVGANTITQLPVFDTDLTLSKSGVMCCDSNALYCVGFTNGPLFTPTHGYPCPAFWETPSTNPAFFATLFTSGGGQAMCCSADGSIIAGFMDGTASINIGNYFGNPFGYAGPALYPCGLNRGSPSICNQ